MVPVKEIQGNDWDLSINRYKEVVHEEVEYKTPIELIKEIEALDAERNKSMHSLKTLL